MSPSSWRSSKSPIIVQGFRFKCQRVPPRTLLRVPFRPHKTGPTLNPADHAILLKTIRCFNNAPFQALGLDASPRRTTKNPFVLQRFKREPSWMVHRERFCFKGLIQISQKRPAKTSRTFRTAGTPLTHRTIRKPSSEI